MVKNLTTILLVILLSSSVFAQWKPAGDKIMTKWGKQVDPSNVLPEYPRPLMERTEWANLNGLWKYAIRPVGEKEPAEFDGDILVPFAVESALSGVQKTVGAENELWYTRTFNIPAAWKGRNVVLNFGAVDWKCEVYVNDIVIGKHQGGYTPFSFDITPYLNDKGEQKLSLRVYDPADKGYQPRGKQISNPQSIWYTSVTGIWQTVWIEPVQANHIISLKTVPDLDNKNIQFTAETSCSNVGDLVTIEILENGKVVSSAKGTPSNTIRVYLKEPKLWSPSDPYLYDVKVTLSNGKNTLDEFKSYTAMRKVSVVKDGQYYKRIALNNQILFNYGPLDQGWWPDGLYTAPSDEALAYDIQKEKELGFNMVRKHVKVEPARWYYHCDKLGILVWQDMPSCTTQQGGTWGDPEDFYGGKDGAYSEEAKQNYYNELNEVMDFCYSNPSVIVWIPFNESWGQFDTEKVVDFIKAKDKSRLIDPASGGNYRKCGDILDLHPYPSPSIRKFTDNKVMVFGEYGGIGMAVQGHLWWDKKNWGYVQFKSSDEVTAEYVKYANMIKDFAKLGMSGAVYTQTTDVEGEVNGLMTYDREVVKVDVKKVNEANTSAINYDK